MRIVSLLPSATEIVCALDLGGQLVGVTHECDWPAPVRALPKVTRTLIPDDASSAEIDALVRERLRSRAALYRLDLPVLEALAPDLIVTQALCDVCAVAEDEVRAAACALPGAPRVLNLEPSTLTQVLEAVVQVGDATGSGARARLVVRDLEARIAAVRARAAGAPRLRVLLLEWLDPPFSAGHWNPELVAMAGGVNGLGRAGERSQTLDWLEVMAWRPEVVVISCCGFGIERTRRDLPLLDRVPGWRDLPAVREGRVWVTDGNQFFSRPGPRLVESLELLAHTIDPARHPLPPALAPWLERVPTP
jgi:iron complex transport system substrate-binding protein